MKRKAPLLVSSLPQTHWQECWLYWVFARVSLGLKPMPGFCRLHGQKTFWRSQQELAGIFTQAQNVPSKPWFHTTAFLSRNHPAHKFMHVDPPSQTGSCPKCFSLSCIYTGVSSQQRSPGPVQSRWKHYPTGVGTGVQHVSPLKAEMPTTRAGLLRLLLSYFIITSAHKQKLYTLQGFLARILM